MTTQITSIDPSKSLNQLIEAYPETLEVFHGFGFDSCCGGTLPLAEVAERHGIKLQDILDAIVARQKQESVA